MTKRKINERNPVRSKGVPLSRPQAVASCIWRKGSDGAEASPSRGGYTETEYEEE